jgi:glycosyltransferase involved in cell wall biosynthesis
MEVLPEGIHMPVPMPDRTPVVQLPERDRALRVLHVVGKRAAHDRNGTDVLVQALRRVRQPVHATIIGIDGQLPQVQRGGNNRLTVEYHPDGFDDRWEMYRNQDVLVLPRRYGGLCLPALEAAACGLAVMMPDCSPNSELASVLVPVRRWTPITFAAGTIRVAECASVDIAEQIDHLARDRDALQAAKNVGATRPTWSRWRENYLDALERLVRS